MYIKKVKLVNFRNYEKLETGFNKKVNIIIGENAQGKTNLIESIYSASLGRSFRTNKFTDMIRFGEDFSKVYIETEKDGYDGNVEIIYTSDSGKSVKIDGVKISRTSELLDNIYIVIFSPEDLKIVKDEPEKRRKFIDRELCQIDPSYYDNFGNYKKVLMQRNTYLKEISVDRSVLDIWDTELARYGSRIIRQRKLFIEKINKISSEIHRNITDGNEMLRIEYDPNVEYFDDPKKQEEFFYKKIKDSFESDMRMRTTMKGPHKDDMEFFINNINVRNFGSQGQQRTAALSLKLAEISIIKEEKSEDPILLLDDVMSELDSSRQEFLIRTLANTQLFITTTDISTEILNKFEEKKVYRIKNGKIEQ